MLSRRRFLASAILAGGAYCAGALLPPWARSGRANDMTGLSALSGRSFDLTVARTRTVIKGRAAAAVTVNGRLPAPLLRWRQGDEITLNVTNRLDEETSIHWHGILVPYRMDGVPGISFPGIAPGQTFTYRFPVRQAGTYWYHSHSGLQEQAGHYGPLIIEPEGPDPVAFDREYVLVLSDWTFEDPDRVFEKLKKHSDVYNNQHRTLGDFFRDARREGFGAAFRDRAMWGRMRMDPTDIADVTAATYTYLVNGHAPADNWTGLFQPGERVRLRIINASAMTIFNFRIPGLPMSVVQADGQNVKPVTVEEFQIGVAETYDVVVAPPDERAWTIMCESIDRSGYGRATLAPRPGMEAPVPPLRPRPLLTMKDMGMAHGAHGDHAGHGGAPSAHGAMNHGAMNHGGHGDHGGHGSMDRSDHSGHGAMDHGATAHGSHTDHAAHAPAAAPVQRHDHRKGAGVDNLAMAPVNRLAEPGIGLENMPHRVLTYADLESLEPNPDRRPPGRELELHLTGNMERFIWSFDGEKLSEQKGPIQFRHGERLRLTMVNDTMMTHPIHLHGMFFDVVTGEHGHKPRKHTINVKPGEKLSLDITADAPGDWAFHCHLLYHMLAGMMAVVSVRGHDHGDGAPS